METNSPPVPIFGAEVPHSTGMLSATTRTCTMLSPADPFDNLRRSLEADSVGNDMAGIRSAAPALATPPFGPEIRFHHTFHVEPRL